MNKTELTAAVAEKLECSKKTAGEAVNAVLDVITDTLVAHEDVSIPGFGSFKCVFKEEAEARNPQTGEAMTVPAHHAVRFKVAANVKEAVK